MKAYDINPKLDSPLMTTLFSMEALRYELTTGTTPSWLFYDLKEVMHLLESLASARIEGNHTTLISAANDVVNKGRKTASEALAELANIRTAIHYIEGNIKKDSPINLEHIREIHKLTMNGLNANGSRNPGGFISIQVEITNSDCSLSLPASIQAEMQELVEYINTPNEQKYDIIKTACAHHRFTKIHPFDDGNGRTARALTYAMLIKQGFLRKNKAIMNPSSIFCIDRKAYYDNLSAADTATEKGIEQWCTYVSNGISNELKRVHKLLDKEYVVSKIMLPALKISREDSLISMIDHSILKIAMEKDIIQASDIMHLFGSTPSDATRCSRHLAKMVGKDLLMKHPRLTKKYVMRFMNQPLLPSTLQAMGSEGLIPMENKSIGAGRRETVSLAA